MPEFGKLRFTRSDTVFSVVFDQSAGAAATLVIDCLYPPGGFLGADRYAEVFIEVDGVEEMLARGYIAGHPWAMPGERVQVEMICRNADYVEKFDAIFAPFDASTPECLAPLGRTRRSEDFIPYHKHVDPVTLAEELVLIGGSAPPVRTLTGAVDGYQGAEILSVQHNITKTPVSMIEFEVEAFFVERRVGVADLWQPDQSQTPVMTATPNALYDALRNLTLDGGGVTPLSSDLQTFQNNTVEVMLEEGGSDPATCLKYPPKLADVGVHMVSSASLEVLLDAEQPRREKLIFRMIPEVQQFGEMEVLRESISLGPVEDLMTRSVGYSYHVDGNWRLSRQSVVATNSFFTEYNAEQGVRQYDPDMDMVINSLGYYASRLALERSHCVELTIETTLSAAYGLTPRDRIVIADQRLAGGYTMGKIVGINLNIGSSEKATLTVECPISKPGENYPGGGFTFNYFYALDQIGVGGPPSSPIVDLMRTSSSAGMIGQNIIANFDLYNAYDVQSVKINESATNNINAVANPDIIGSLDKTGVEIELVDLEAIPVEDLGVYEIRTQPATMKMQQGITLS